MQASIFRIAEKDCGDLGLWRSLRNLGEMSGSTQLVLGTRESIDKRRIQAHTFWFLACTINFLNF